MNLIQVFSRHSLDSRFKDKTLVVEEEEWRFIIIDEFGEIIVQFSFGWWWATPLNFWTSSKLSSQLLELCWRVHHRAVYYRLLRQLCWYCILDTEFNLLLWGAQLPLIVQVSPRWILLCSLRVWYLPEYSFIRRHQDLQRVNRRNKTLSFCLIINSR